MGEWAPWWAAFKNCGPGVSPLRLTGAAGSLMVR